MKLPELAPKQGLWILWLTAPLVLIDQVTKRWAAAVLKESDAITVIPNFWDFVYVENRGALWGLGSEFSAHARLVIFRIFSALITLIVIGLLFVKTDNRRHLAVYALIIAGAIGNLIDRFAYGYVIDFIDWRLGALYHHPTFNIADAAIVAAIGLVILDMILTRKQGTGA